MPRKVRLLARRSEGSVATGGCQRRWLAVCFRPQPRGFGSVCSCPVEVTASIVRHCASCRSRNGARHLAEHTYRLARCCGPLLGVAVRGRDEQVAHCPSEDFDSEREPAWQQPYPCKVESPWPCTTTSGCWIGEVASRASTHRRCAIEQPRASRTHRTSTTRCRTQASESSMASASSRCWSMASGTGA